jgi:predicted SnoaL-like aldol condensation-catalyzing enzyme
MTAQSHRDAAVEFLRLAASGKVRDAYAKHVGPGFRHHNPHFRGDAKSLMEAMEQNAAKNPEKTFEVKRALQDGEQVAVFSHVRQKPSDNGAAVVHILRFEGDRIVELWDVGQPIPEKPVNENGMF